MRACVQHVHTRTQRTLNALQTLRTPRTGKFRRSASVAAATAPAAASVASGSLASARPDMEASMAVTAPAQTALFNRSSDRVCEERGATDAVWREKKRKVDTRT